MSSLKKSEINLEKEFSEISQKYKILNLIGEGSYGIVVKAINKKTNKTCAIKKLKNIISDSINSKRLLREINIFRQLSEYPNKYIIQLYDIIIPNEKLVNSIYLIMEYCDLNLFQLIHSNFKFNYEIIKKITTDILKGLLYIFKRGIIHRDMKPDNILIKIENNSFTAKLCDFSLSRDLTLDFSTEDLLNYFFTEYEYKNMQFTEEGININELREGIENENLNEEMRIYINKKLDELSEKLFNDKNRKIPITNFIIDSLYLDFISNENKFNCKNYYDLYKIYKEQDKKFKNPLTPKIITRFYRPPEILLLEKIYTYSIDIWGLGCIIGEMLLKKLGFIQPLIPGDSSFFISPNEIEGNINLSDNDQLTLILQLFGGINNNDLNFISDDYKKQFTFHINESIKNKKDKIIYIEVFNKLDDKYKDLIWVMKNMLKFNPCDRIKPASALRYLHKNLDINLKIEYPIIYNKWERIDFDENDLKKAFIEEMNEWNISKMEFSLNNFGIKDFDNSNNVKIGNCNLFNNNLNFSNNNNKGSFNVFNECDKENYNNKVKGIFD